jgi:hypothetical protein
MSPHVTAVAPNIGYRSPASDFPVVYGTMKFWQLVSITRSADRDLISRIARTRLEWNAYEPLALSFPQLVRAQDREALDSRVNVEFAQAVLEETEGSLFLSRDGWLRSWRVASADLELSLLDSFNKYGADVVEDVLEYGCVRVL